VTGARDQPVGRGIDVNMTQYGDASQPDDRQSKVQDRVYAAEL